MRLWAGQCKRMFKGLKPDAILTYLSFHSELMSEVAAYYSLLSGIPMTVIIYDDALAFSAHDAAETRRIGDRFRWILRSARQRWFVSEQLAVAYGLPPDPQTVLMPIPDGIGERVEWRSEFSVRPKVVYAGFLYEQQYELIRQLGKVIHEAGGQLLLLSRDTVGLRNLCVESGIEFQPLLPTNRDALRFVGNCAAAFVAAYCGRVDDMPWIKSSFPSKVVEFGHLGLPVLFVSPPESAVYSWNQERNLPYNLRPDETGRVVEFVNALKNPIQWKALAEPIRRLAETEFNPKLIQQRLVEHLA